MDYTARDIEIRYGEIPRRSNSTRNYMEYFENGEALEYYYKGTSKNGNMDWHSMILVYQKVNNRLCLSAIILEYWRP